jgi:integrase
MALTNTAVKGAKPRDKQWKLSDGGGLHLLIHPNGSKYWRLKFRYAGKEKVLALGIYPEISLAKARLLQSEAKTLLHNGTDPSLVRKQQKRTGRINAENTFEAIALDWFEQQKGLWSKGHADRVLISLEQDAFPYIGYRPIAELTPPDILEVIRKVESRDALDVAGRILQRCSAICRYAVQTGRAQMNPASELKGVLKTRKVKHRPAVTRAELPEFLRQISSYDGHAITRFALKLLNLTFVRPAELRFSKWKEFEIEKKIWRVPGERFDIEGNQVPGMKMGAEHLVPLSRQALELLEEIRLFSGQGELVFPGERSRKKPISENTMLYALYRMGYKGRATAHGFRTTASSILNEEGFNPDAVERQLSHVERNQVRGAYTHHAKYLKERTTMMQWWGDYLERIEL